MVARYTVYMLDPLGLTWEDFDDKIMAEAYAEIMEGMMVSNTQPLMEQLIERKDVAIAKAVARYEVKKAKHIDVKEKGK